MSGQMLVDQSQLLVRYPYEPLVVKHNLQDHPLFTIPELLKLRNELPDKKIDYYTGKVEVNTDRATTSPTGLTPEETIRRIRECESWLVLKNVEQVPRYKELLDHCLKPLRPAIEINTPGMRQLEAWIFITSPQSIAPYHLDPEHNILLQVHGKKIVHIWDARDKEILSDEEAENFIMSGGTAAKLEYREEYEKKDNVFVLNPGEGVHIPFLAPHWTKVEDEYSISFSVSFYSNVCDRMNRLYRFNSRMRRLGLTPTPLGISPKRDALKDSLISTFVAGRNLFKSNRGQ